MRLPDQGSMRSLKRKRNLFDCAYKATLAALENGEAGKATELQLLALDSFQKFNDQLLKAIELQRKEEARHAA